MDPAFNVVVAYIAESAIAHDTRVLELAIKHTRAGKFDIDSLRQLKEAADHYIVCYNIVEIHMCARPRDVVHIIHVDRLAGLSARALINLTDEGVIDPEALVRDAGMTLEGTARDLLCATVDIHKQWIRELTLNCVTAGFMIRAPNSIVDPKHDHKL